MNIESTYNYKKSLKNKIQKFRKSSAIKRVILDYQLYLLLIPALFYIILFCYGPMYGVIIAFKDYAANLGILGSPWVGFKYFEQFFSLPNFWTIIGNTVGLSVYSLVVGFPLSICLAIMINELSGKYFKKTVQMVTYAPYFISMVVMCGIITLFLNQDYGLINNIVSIFGGKRIDFLIKPEYFKTVYVVSSAWQSTGWSTIIYLAALSTIDPQLIESSYIDGVTRIQKIWYIDIPGIVPTIIILLILNIGHLLSVGFEKVLLLQNALNMESSDIISTFVYRIGLLGGQYSLSTAIGLFNSIINFILLVSVNKIAAKFSETSLW